MDIHALTVTQYGHFRDGMRMTTQPMANPKAGEILADVEFVGLNPHDCKLAAGEMQRHEPKKLPMCPATNFLAVCVRPVLV